MCVFIVLRKPGRRNCCQRCRLRSLRTFGRLADSCVSVERHKDYEHIVSSLVLSARTFLMHCSKRIADAATAAVDTAAKNSTA